jgi:hypothetical protein
LKKNYENLDGSMKRRALLFCIEEDSRVEDLKSGLLMCGFRVHLLGMQYLYSTLNKSTMSHIKKVIFKSIFLVSLCGLSSEEGWLMVFIIAPIEKSVDGEIAELAVKISNKLVPMQQLTGLFVGSKCVTYAKKPKVFFFLDFEAGKKVDGPRVIYVKSVISIVLNGSFFSLQCTSGKQIYAPV